MDDKDNLKPGQIRVGAGLEESRLNQDFLDFIRKWSTPILLVVALIAVGFVAFQKYHQSQREKLDKAFGELEALNNSPSPSPDSLSEVARQYEGVAAVAPLARLRAGDSLLLSLQTGLKAGAKPKADGSPEQPEDVLSEADRTTVIFQAQQQYEMALKDSRNIKARRSIEFGAIFGLGALAESKGDFEKAKDYYQQIITLVDADPLVEFGNSGEKQRPFATNAAIAKHRIESLGSMKDLPMLASEAQLPKLPPLPGAAPATPPIFDLPPGVTVEPVPSGPPTNVPPASPVDGGAPPAPAPAPVPAPPEPAPK